MYYLLIQECTYPFIQFAKIIQNWRKKNLKQIYKRDVKSKKFLKIYDNKGENLTKIISILIKTLQDEIRMYACNINFV